MIHAYDKVYLDKARTALGRMLDFAVYDPKYDISEFFDLFISSGVAERFETGDFSVIVGMSGVELAYKVLEQSSVERERVNPNYTASRSEEFWLGWALAYYQWETSLRFAEIVQYVPIKDMIALYMPYHEMDIRQFVDQVNAMYKAAKPETNLKLLRQKNINKAQAEYLVALARVLCCEVEDLMEKVE